MSLENSVVHFEIPAENVERAQEFYKKAFQWKINPIPQMQYTILHTTPVDEKMMLKEKGAINGGMLKKNDMVKAPSITINVANFEKAVKEIEKAGGKMLSKKTTVGDMGYMAYFKDTEGNVMSIWENIKK